MAEVVGLRATLFFCFYLSGCSALIYEVVWTRYAVASLGAALHAVATVLAAFMGGLALGAALAGRWADRRPAHNLKLYGWLELAIAALGVGLPFAHLGNWPGPTLLWVSLSVLLPTTLMGATLPVLAKLVTEDLQALGCRVGNLYSANTSGAMLGTLLAGFFLIPKLGLRASLWVAALLNVLAALPCLLWRGESQDTTK